MRHENYLEIAKAIDELAWEMFERGYDKGFNRENVERKSLFLTMTQLERVVCQNKILAALMIKECPACEKS
jgi:hypothetical protein